MPQESWIGVDLDGTLAEYDGWAGATHIGRAIPKMLARVKAWLAAGKKVKLVTARAAPLPEGAGIGEQIEHNFEIKAFHRAWADWCRDNDLPVLEVTCQKDFKMVRQWDDRAVQVEENTGVAIEDRLQAVRTELKQMASARHLLLQEVDWLSRRFLAAVGHASEHIRYVNDARRRHNLDPIG